MTTVRLDGFARMSCNRCRPPPVSRRRLGRSRVRSADLPRQPAADRLEQCRERPDAHRHRRFRLRKALGFSSLRQSGGQRGHVCPAHVRFTLVHRRPGDHRRHVRRTALERRHRSHQQRLRVRRQRLPGRERACRYHPLANKPRTPFGGSGQRARGSDRDADRGSVDFAAAPLRHRRYGEPDAELARVRSRSGQRCRPQRLAARPERRDGDAGERQRAGVVPGHGTDVAARRPESQPRRIGALPAVRIVHRRRRRVDGRRRHRPQLRDAAHRQRLFRRALCRPVGERGNVGRRRRLDRAGRHRLCDDRQRSLRAARSLLGRIAARVRSHVAFEPGRDLHALEPLSAR